MEYKGYNGTIVSESDHLTITHSGLAAKGGGLATGQPRVIPLQAVSGVALKGATALTNGWLTLGLGGERAVALGATTAPSDPNTVMFRRKDREKFAELHEWLMTVIAHNEAVGVNQAAVTFDAAAPTRLDRMEAHAEGAQVEREKANQARAKRAEEAKQAKAQRAEERDKKQAELREKAGPEVAHGSFALNKIRIYQNGYVSISLPMFGSSLERLIAIESSSDVSKKSGVGRGLGALATAGLSLAGSNKRGDVYLAITTDVKTHLLHADPPTAMNLNTVKRLEAAGNAVIRARDAGQAAGSGAGTRSTADKLRDLEALNAEGLVSADEYAEKRAKLLGEL